MGEDYEISIVSKHKSFSQSKDPVFSDLSAVSSLASFDYFIISNETDKHYQTLAELNSKVSGKKILVEKPVFEKPYSLPSSQNEIYVAYHLRFSPLLQFVKEKISPSKVIYVHAYVGQYLPEWRPGRDYRTTYSASMERGGGVLRDLSHELDYIFWLFGDPVEMKTMSKKCSDLAINSDDIFLAIGQLKHGAMVNVSMDYFSKKKHRTCFVHTNSASYYLDFLTNQISIHKPNHSPKVMNYANPEQGTAQEMHTSILFRQGEDVCTLAQGSRTVEFIERSIGNDLSL